MPKGARSRPGWVKVREGNHGGCGARWEHPNGWAVEHCGHPTANFPYYGIGPGGEMMLQHGIGKGYAFRYLTDAQVACELEQHNRDTEKING